MNTKIEVKGMLVNVYRNGDACDNDGISAKYNRVLLVGENIPEIFEANDLPVVKLRSNQVFNKTFLNASPLDDDKKWYMFGGSFIYTSDSRFPSPYPIPLHDRTEEC